MLIPSILTGIFIGTSYIPFPPWATLFAFVPIWFYWCKVANSESVKTPLKKIFLAGWLAQLILTFIGFNWVAHTVEQYGHFSRPLAILTLIAYCAIANLDLPLTGVFWYWLQKKLKLQTRERIILLALMTALIKSVAPNLFPWNYGYTWLWVDWPIAQTAELIGFNGLSSIIIILNLGFYFAWAERSYKPVFFSIFIFLGLNVGGLALKNTLPKTDLTLTAAITQANIGNLEKQYAEHQDSYREHIFGRYSALMRSEYAAQAALAPEIDFIVWPETAYPYDLDQRIWSKENALNIYPFYAQQLIALTKEFDAHLFTGGYGISPHDNRMTNTFFVFEREGTIQKNPYYKTILLPLGEYMPGRDLWPSIRRWVPQEIGNFSHGRGPQVNVVKLKNESELRFGQQICYESLYPAFTRELANIGAQVIVNLTNDSWYGTWQEPYQHLYMTLARAIEFRRPVIRSTNTGISTVILASGEILEKSPLDKEWVGVYQVPYQSQPVQTIYQLYPWLIDALLLLIMGLIVYKSKSRL